MHIYIPAVLAEYRQCQYALQLTYAHIKRITSIDNTDFIS